MKRLHFYSILVAVFLLVSACKKHNNDQVVVISEIPKEWHMTGTIGNEQFVATSLNASVNKYPDGKLELNVNGWNKPTDQTIYLSVQNYKGVGEYKIAPFVSHEAYTTNAWYDKDHSNQTYSPSGTIIIQYAAPEMITGAFKFWINDRKITGEFGIKPNYSDK